MLIVTFFLLPLTPIPNAQVPPVSWVHIRQVSFGKSCSIPLRDHWKGVEAFIICWFKKNKKIGEGTGEFLITLKFCKYDVSFSLARTFFPRLQAGWPDRLVRPNVLSNDQKLSLFTFFAFGCPLQCLLSVVWTKALLRSWLTWKMWACMFSQGGSSPTCGWCIASLGDKCAPCMVHTSSLHQHLLLPHFVSNYLIQFLHQGNKVTEFCIFLHM